MIEVISLLTFYKPRVTNNWYRYNLLQRRYDEFGNETNEIAGVNSTDYESCN